MSTPTVRIALASLAHPRSIPEGIARIEETLKHAATEGALIVCFPETYLPGLRGAGLSLPPPDRGAQRQALESICDAARRHVIAAIVGMEWSTDDGLLNLAQVVSSDGRLLGHQAKNQITPGGESRSYIPDGERRIFDVGPIRFGIAICHEGWRYPETVRWAARRGAQIVFQPQVTGSDSREREPQAWGDSFYEKAMVCRAQENTIYFASVNTAMRYQSSATSLVGPDGKCIAYLSRGKEETLFCDIDLAKATRLYAQRFNPDWYPPER